ncbi:MAG: amidohydrolase [Bacillota bacterium]|nr:amidohydrolase [Bacillota bacterium]
MKDQLSGAIDARAPQLIALSDDVWRHAELGLLEHKSSAQLAAFLGAAGFSIRMGVANMDTAFVAAWGGGGPVIGLLGEYDALPGISNQPVPHREPVEDNPSGHGCGHNLLGVAAAGAAVALKELMQAQGLPGTVRFFGCPAEESSFGKMWMVCDGAFSDVDVVLTWHPGGVNAVTFTSSLADWVYKFNFYGKTAHAAANPHEGRSALDALELMNEGVERMREHMRPECRIHYVITHGGQSPNVVPDYAQSFYDVRAATVPDLVPMYAWVEQIGQGAAMMTQTRFEPEFIGAAANTLANGVIGDVLQAALESVGPPAFGNEELAFAAQLQGHFPGCAERALRDLEARASHIRDTRVCDVVLPLDATEKPGKGSTDVGDVSWVVPTGQFSAACYAFGIPGHTWAATACSGSSIGHKGMLCAAKVLAFAGARFVTEPGLRAAAREEHQRRLGGHVYKSSIPEGVTRPPMPFGDGKGK